MLHISSSMHLRCTSCVLIRAGGRVSDSFDQRVLTTYLEEYFGEFLFDTFQPFHFYVRRDGDSIGLPPTGPREVYVKAIDALPLVQSPEVRAAAPQPPSTCACTAGDLCWTPVSWFGSVWPRTMWSESTGS